MRVYDTAFITHSRMRTWNFFRNLIIVMAEVYDMVTITLRWNASIRHDRYHPATITHCRMQAYGTAAITHCRMQAYGIAAITHYKM